MFIMDNTKHISELIFKHEIEMIYWNNYIIGLFDYMCYSNLTKEQIHKINSEIVRVNNYKKHLAEIISTKINQNESINQNKSIN